MKLIIPSEFQIGGHTYSIAFSKALIDDNDYGVVNHRLQKVLLNPVRPTSQMVGALIHELLHIINNVYLNAKLTEDEIDGMSEGLLQVSQQLGAEPDFSQIPEEKL